MSRPHEHASGRVSDHMQMLAPNIEVYWKFILIDCPNVQRLPVSLQARIAQVQCRPTLNRNMHVFATCNEQFLSRFMMNLSEVSVMPGEGATLRFMHIWLAHEFGFDCF